ncbi:MAG: hypothetical protein HN576_07015 [Bacteriovoracaceae bacterium]|jgi:hypothetical protein|nr:hypothetical protein [Bacteriovoracaceae bacterium]
MNHFLFGFFLLLIDSSWAFDFGGVDVGNGHTVISEIETITYSTEEELINYGEILMGIINSGFDPEAIALATSGQCNLNNFRFKKMNMFNFYPPVKKERFSLKRFHAKILVEFYNCVSPLNIDKSQTMALGVKQ